MQGKVRCFDRGFGFIDGIDGRSYFVHHTGINQEGFRVLYEGEEVRFDIKDDDPRGPVATNVVVTWGFKREGYIKKGEK